jgi:hypothetical protein
MNSIPFYCATISENVEDGKLDPVKAYIEVYEAEKLLKELRQELQNPVMNKISADREYTCGGYKVSTQSRTSWKFNDPEIDRLKTLIKSREIQGKRAFKHLESDNVFTDENGEIVPPAECKTTNFIKLEVIR